MTTVAVISLIVAICLAFWLLEELRRHDRTKRALARRDKALDELLRWNHSQRRRLLSCANARRMLSQQLDEARNEAATHICDDSPKSTVTGLVKPPTE